jgi:hypothetical protein
VFERTERAIIHLKRNRTQNVISPNPLYFTRASFAHRRPSPPSILTLTPVSLQPALVLYVTLHEFPGLESPFLADPMEIPINVNRLTGRGVEKRGTEQRSPREAFVTLSDLIR